MQVKSALTLLSLSFLPLLPVRGDGNILVAVKAFVQAEVSVIDLSDPDVTCQSFDAGPLEYFELSQSLHGTFVGGDLMVCGQEAQDCSTFNAEELEWIESEANRADDRFLPFGMDLGEGRHWVSGGDNDGLLEDSSEMFDGTSFSPSVQLPFPTRDHCAVQVADDEVILMAGKDKEDTCPQSED